MTCRHLTCQREIRLNELEALLEGRPVDPAVDRSAAGSAAAAEDRVIVLDPRAGEVSQTASLDEVLDALLAQEIDVRDVDVNGGLPSKQLPRRTGRARLPGRLPQPSPMRVFAPEMRARRQQVQQLIGEL